jgi:hypothetical protein
MAAFVVSGRNRESDHIRCILLNTGVLDKNNRCGISLFLLCDSYLYSLSTVFLCAYL